MMDNKENPKVSIIVPVYNVENYLSKCLDSIISQTFSNWECILIDDGSLDNSGAICDKYLDKDDRFRVIHQKNSGVSVARNVGLDNAKGEWISFVDRDDWISKDMVSSLYEYAIKQDADVVVSGDIRTDGLRKQEEYCPKLGWMSMPRDYDVHWQGPCAKLFKKTLLYKNNIKFPLNISIAEDLFFTFCIFIKTKKIFGVNKAYYYYYQNPNSVMHSLTTKKIFDEKKVLDEIEILLNESSADFLWYAWLKTKKVLCKNKSVLRLSKPDCKLWNNIYPELSKEIIKKSQGLKKIYFLCVLFSITGIVDKMFNIRMGKVFA